MPTSFLKLLAQLDSSLTNSKNVVLTGERTLDISSITAVANQRAKVTLNPTSAIKKKAETIFSHMLKQVESGVPIYGTTSAYGGQASRVLTQGDRQQRTSDATALSKAITHVDVSTGDPLPIEVTRAAMLIRTNMLLTGHSSIRLSQLENIAQLLNLGITPVVGRYGTVSASGDLAQNGRVLSVLLQLPTAKVFDQDGQVKFAHKVLARHEILPIELLPKEGLALVNGDNFSTAAAALIAQQLTAALVVNFATASMTIEALRGSTRDFHPLLDALRPHPGQAFSALLLRTILDGSSLAYQEMKGHVPRPTGMSVQDPYSIRCLPQFYGPDWETLLAAWETITINANGVSDNPLWTSPEYVTEGEQPYQWVSGGNFLAMHMSDTIDKLRKIAIHIVKQSDRHLSRLVHPALNQGLPANLSSSSSVSQCLFKGLQTQMGMYEVYASVLAAPFSTAFGVHEELNQDLTSHALSSSLVTWEVLKVMKLAVATNLIAGCQAVDLRGGPQLLAPVTRQYYELVRNVVPFIETEQPLGHYVEQVAELVTTPGFVQPVIKAVTYE
jgi:phenylalanine ammonia-lyase